MSKKHLLKSAQVAVITAGVSLTAVVLAAPGERFPIDLEAHEAKAAERFSTMDANSDGGIDATEFENAKFNRDRHAKRSGKHKKRHGMRSRDGKRGEFREEMKAAIQTELFALLDTNEDGQLSADEHAAKTREMGKLARKRAMFKRLDANQDGVLHPDEVPGNGARLRNADTDGDGQVTRQEMRAAFRAG